MPALILDTADVAAFIRTARPPLDVAGAPIFAEFQRQLLAAITSLQTSRLTIAACPDEDKAMSDVHTAGPTANLSAGTDAAAAGFNGSGTSSGSGSTTSSSGTADSAMSTWPFSATMDGTTSDPAETGSANTLSTSQPNQGQDATSLPLFPDQSYYNTFQAFFGPVPSLTDVPPSPSDTADHVIDWPVIVALLRGRPAGIMIREIWKLYKGAHAQLPPSARKFNWSAVCAHYRNRCRGSQLISDLSTVVHFMTCPVRAVETDALHSGIRLVDFKTPYYTMRQSPRVWCPDTQNFE
ncbi:hypothetical protein OC844_006609 [Tilletia horrida]|nr:hypothetical protein OC844_006609 [Tilletia horrida]